MSLFCPELSEGEPCEGSCMVVHVSVEHIVRFMMGLSDIARYNDVCFSHSSCCNGILNPARSGLLVEWTGKQSSNDKYESTQDPVRNEYQGGE